MPRSEFGFRDRADGFLDGLLFGGARALLSAVAAFEVDARRIVRFGAEGVDLDRAFPSAAVRPGRPIHGWAGWPDLVWTELAFGGSPEPRRLAAEIWLAMPVGASLAALEVEQVGDEATRRWLTRGRGIQAGPSALRAVADRFRIQHESRVRSPCGSCVTRALLVQK